MPKSLDPIIGLEESLIKGETLGEPIAGLNIRPFGQTTGGVNVDRRAVEI